SDMQNLINATAIAIVFLDRDLQVMRYTPSAVALFNLIPGDLGRPLADLATRLQYPELGADARRVLDHLIPVEREVGLPDGRWFMARLLPYRTLDDRISGVVLSFIEITERKQAEEMRLWLSAVVNSSGDAIISFALDQTILSWNAGAEAMFGYSAAEVIGQPLALLAPEHEAEQDQLLAGVAEGQPLSNHETVRWRKDGGSLDVALSLSPIRDADGRIIGGTAIARDISQARRAAQALRDSEERMRLLVENVREFGVFSMDLERRITVWNTGAERLLGWREEEVLGQMADVIFTPEDRADGAPIREASAALAEGRASDDRWHLRKDGSRFWASGAAMLMRNPPGEAVGFVKILRDQTAARQAQQALERSQAELVAALDTNMSHRKELEAADVAKDRFLAVLSHELRNPLASIASAAALMGQSELDQGDRGHAGEVVRRQAAAVRALLDDLLDISRLRLGKLTLQQRPTGIAAVVRSGLETAAPVLEGLGHSAAVRLPANELEVHGDPLRLAQVVNNLVTNAAKYTPAGGHISVSAELADGQVVVTVEDDGIGMEPDQIDQMFDMFTQSSAALERAEGGLGIGLALARSIVELHGGWIKASSNGLGHGSRFTFGLPLLRTTSARPEPVQIVPANAPAPQPAPQRGQGTQVLIADDNMDAAWGVAKLLELSGWRPLMASTGEEALKLAQEHQPAAMVLDIGMPDMDGHEVARRLRATPWGRDAVLVAATGWGQESDMRESLEAGFDAHLIKPIDVRQLQGVIEEHLGRRAR
ncbi:MAG TPA: PAS domain S-box protein, partial [Ramlibacter sp.]|nr:PAS domain S-box protein [Ramlibacter sp.]